MNGRWIKGLMAISALSGFIWLGGLGWTLQDYFAGAVDTPAAPAPVEEETAPPIPDDGKFRVVALGDSLTRGAGDPDGKGYVGYMTDELKTKAADQDVLVNNYGFDGMRTPELTSSLAKPAVRAELKAADVIVVSIGGNDLFRSGETLGNLDPGYIATIQEAYLNDLDGVLKELRTLNASAELFLIGLYNPFIARENAETTTKIVRDWNYRAAETAADYPDTVLVPTLDLFQLKIQDYLALDQFHPNAEGYKLIGERVASLITWEEESE
ncbi:GDSL-type esterase/lipase family protein [Paenibacillus methanolicus]|uniref:Lysophospholipase L1-like esterase n=1 Tax=Paenibacillus methanolicus TaxID=582686 RepID=A0A5S5CH97_9BACL|nr:GDSL-type esterase/lipase family protein [Paenibacillus methanolicus]TYP79169.1 lysophospholipase L1-like esterase [Paenibacillus methanolicus]